MIKSYFTFPNAYTYNIDNNDNKKNDNINKDKNEEDTDMNDGLHQQRRNR